ncbi:MAG: uroporphyrinogen decarboxylase family protein [Armatimonadota bacterium]
MASIFDTTPDYRRLTEVLTGKKADRIPIYEFFSDPNIQMEAIDNNNLPDPSNLGNDEELNTLIRNQYYLGYDYLPANVDLNFSGLTGLQSMDSEGNIRYFLDEQHNAITSREDMEKYPWPKPEDLSYHRIEYCSKYAPEGMKVVANLGGGLFEWGTWLMGTENFCLKIYEDPDFIKDFLKRVNDQQVAAASESAKHEDVIAVILGDDLGFKTQTFLPPAILKEYIFPGLKRVCDAVHNEGKPFILHSCGYLNDVMDDLIDFVGIDAKHSYEDVITPVTKAKELWGDRIALLGGVDVDFLCRADESSLRAYVRNIMEKCGDKGFALGSGNSIANYVPPKSLRIMNEEAIMCQM